MFKKPNGFKWLKISTRILTGLLVTLAVTACQGRGSPFNFKAFKERATETPSPTNLNFEKSFFLSADGKTPKTFMCGWAPEVEIGDVGQELFSHLDAAAPHCNLEFENEDEEWLIGRLVNPSFPNDRRQWKEYVRIHIRSHFYYERSKDQYGRETNEWIENSTRSDWSARPMFKLDLNSIQFADSGIIWSTRLSSLLTHSTATEIEKDEKNGFLGFTLNVRLQGGQFGIPESEAQARVRVNFLRYNHDSRFKKTPYHQEDARHMNILHVMGKRHELEPELYAAKWDFSKPVNLYINNADDKAVQALLISAVEKWNQTFIDEGVVGKGQKAFVPVIQNREHAFDLRYPGITYVADRRISQRSALGVGYAHADVMNGKIMWGHVLIFGGMIEGLVHTYTSSEGGSGSGGDSAATAFSFDSKLMGIPEKLRFPETISKAGAAQTGELQRQLLQDGQAYLQQTIASLNADKKAGMDAQIKSLSAQMTALSNPRFGAKVAADLTKQASDLRSKGEAQLAGKSFRDLMGLDQQGKSTKSIKLAMSPEDRSQINDIFLKNKPGVERNEKLRTFTRTPVSGFPDQDMTGKNIRAAMARAEGSNHRTFREKYDSVMMELILHEIGHMVGLGHQFKENILPVEGTVPNRIYKELVEAATPERDYVNMTSVMGYLSGRTWLALDAKTLTPGPQDRLVVRYLYKQEYATYDKAKDSFRFFAMPAHGRIPMQTSTADGILPAAYFPQCNDIEASYDADPFCNRWDRGHTAELLVKSYFEDLTDNLVGDLYSFVGGRRADPDSSENWLWWKSFSTMSRTRLFYDEMRLRLSTDRELVPLWNQVRRSEQALYEFSTACMATDESKVVHPALKELFFKHGQKSSDIRDLCRASNVALHEMRFLLTLPEADYTKIDTKERYIMSGYLVGDTVHDSRQIFGKWYQLTNLPLKVAALYTLTTSYPYMMPGYANPFYTMEGRAPLYRTLYPTEYTTMVADMVVSNMRFENLDDVERSALGNVILSAAWLLPQQIHSKDAGLLPTDFNRVLNSQTDFQFSMAAILITANDSQSKSDTEADHYKRFVGTMYDLMLNKQRPLRDVYLLPKGSAIVRANDMFLVPVTQLRFLDDKSAYLIAIKVDYDSEVGDKLVEKSVKAKLTELHERMNRECISDNGSGLSSFFIDSNRDFKGFYIPKGIAEESSKEGMAQFFRSLDENFATYENSVQSKMSGRLQGKTMKLVCDQAIRSVGQISSAAALLNGLWLPITPISLN